ncbi:MAG: hemin uptake protein HemP [Planctomycetota bacterium]
MEPSSQQKNSTDHSIAPAPEKNQTYKHFRFEDLAEGMGEIQIWLNEERYTLKRTKAGKLVLHK